jgi:hypothetical protein
MFKSLSLLVIAIVSFSLPTMAGRGTTRGAVSGGGGGTTNPEPSNPYWVTEAIRSYSGPIISMFLNHKESLFEDLTDEEKMTSVYAKLFRPTSGKNIFEILKSTKIEVRMNETCYDANNEAWDGSIYATQPNAICISAFNLASKINSRYLASETLALLVHELSHLAGTTEEEAQEIQEDFISINQSQMLDAKTKLQLLSEAFPAGRFGEPMLGLKYWINVPSEASANELELWTQQLINLRNYEMQMGSNLQAVRSHSYKLFTPMVIKLRVIREYVCVNNEKEDTQLRDYCADRLKLGFAGDSVVTVMTYQTRNGYTYLGNEYSDVSLRKINGLPDISLELADMQKYLQALHVELKELNAFKPEMYLK